MCYAFGLDSTSDFHVACGVDSIGKNHESHYGKSIEATDLIDSSSKDKSQHDHVLPVAEVMIAESLPGNALKRHANPAAHDDERPSKVGKMAGDTANHGLQQSTAENSKDKSPADVMEVDTVSVVARAEDDESVADKANDSAGGNDDQAASVVVKDEDPLSTVFEIHRLKSHIAEQDRKLEEARARIKEQDSKLKNSVQKDDADAKLERVKLQARQMNARKQSEVDAKTFELDEAKEQLSELKAEYEMLRHQHAGLSAPSKTKSGVAPPNIKEQFKDIQKKADERATKKTTKMKEDCDAKLKKAKDDHKAAIEKLKKDHKQHLEKKEEVWSDKIDDLKEKHTEREAATKQAFDSKLDAWKAKFQRLVNEARSERDNAVESKKEAKRGFAEDAKKLKAEQQEEIKKHKPETANAVKALETELAESNKKVERLTANVAEQKDLAVKAIEEMIKQKGLVTTAAEMIERERAEMDDLKEKLATKEAEFVEERRYHNQACKDVAFHRDQAAEWRMRAEAHQRGVHGLSLSIKGRDKALDGMRRELKAALNENERLRVEAKRLMGESAVFMDEGCA